MTTYLKPVPAQGRQNCGEPCSCKDILVDKIRSIFEHKATRYLQETREKKGNVCRSWNSRPHTQSRTEASKTGGCFFFEREKKISHCTRCVHAWHTAHRTVTVCPASPHSTQHAQTWMIMYPKPVPPQETQSCGKPCRFQRDTSYYMSKKNTKKNE